MDGYCGDVAVAPRAVAAAAVVWPVPSLSVDHNQWRKKHNGEQNKI